MLWIYFENLDLFIPTIFILDFLFATVCDFIKSSLLQTITSFFHLFCLLLFWLINHKFRPQACMLAYFFLRQSPRNLTTSASFTNPTYTSAVPRPRWGNERLPTPLCSTPPPNPHLPLPRRNAKPKGSSRRRHVLRRYLSGEGGPPLPRRLTRVTRSVSDSILRMHLRQ